MSTSKKQSKKSVSIIDQLDAKGKKQAILWVESIGEWLGKDKEESQAIFERLLKALFEKGITEKKESRKEKAIDRTKKLEKKIDKIWHLFEKNLSILENIASGLVSFAHKENEIWDLQELREWEERFKGK